MIEHRIDHVTRERASEMSPEEMRDALLVFEQTDLLNNRAQVERLVGQSPAPERNSRRVLKLKSSLGIGTTLYMNMDS
jgi:hypothetical protein